MKIIKPIIPFLIASVFTGCLSTICNSSQIDSNSFEIMHQNDQETLSNFKIKKDRPIIVTTFVNIDAIDAQNKTSTLGRTIQEDIKSILVNKHYNVIELTLRKSIFIKKNDGEFILSRDIKKIANKQQVYAIITGTYTVGYNKILVNIEAINPANDKIIYSSSYTLPLDNNMRKLLNMPLIKPIYCDY
jgi:TolB-like protein